MKNFLISLLIVLSFFMFPLPSLAEESPLSELDHIAGRVLEMTRAERYEEAQALLDFFSNEFSMITAQQNLLSMDELRIVLVSSEQAKQALHEPSLPSEERLKNVTSFRLAVDAIASEYEPLWTQMEGRIMSAFSDVRAAAIEGDRKAYQERLNNFLSQYSIIQPSIKLDLEVEKVQLLDAKISFIDDERTEVMESVEAMAELEGLHNDLEVLFDNVTEDEADPSLWWVIITTGSIIMGTLSYVGFRKYKAEKVEKHHKKLKD
ncbi:sporulation protein YpjB [Bacillus spongiae]|uniref:Sporulation protein YpjB n=1 Tax=Bacillus spongiae TaxID=2683610 RepID=A0ABU8HD60_9BACI